MPRDQAAVKFARAEVNVYKEDRRPSRRERAERDRVARDFDVLLGRVEQFDMSDEERQYHRFQVDLNV